MTAPVIVGVLAPAGPEAAPDAVPLVLGPSLGTTTSVWDRARTELGSRHPVFAWDLPGHGVSPAATHPFTMSELAEAMLRAVDAAGIDRFAFAGISLGGVVGLQLALDHPDRVAALTLVCSLPRIGTPEGWRQRASDVRTKGTPSLVTGSASRWFTAEFLEREPDATARILHRLLDIDDESYALCVEALGATDLRERLAELRIPLNLVVGDQDPVIPVAEAQAIVAAAPQGSLHVVPGTSHLAAVERPDLVAALITTESSTP